MSDANSPGRFAGEKLQLDDTAHATSETPCTVATGQEASSGRGRRWSGGLSVIMAFAAGVALTWVGGQYLASPADIAITAAPARCVETHIHVSPEQSGSWVQLPQLSHFLNFSASRVIYLNREGATLHGGVDDASENRSSVVRAAGLVNAEIPAFAGNAAEWNALTACIRSKFKAYDVRITDKRPLPSQSYLMAMFGGDARALGRPEARSVGGLAPFNGEPIARSVVYVFTEALRRDPAAMCETASMELAHAFGLDHAYDCAEVMSYLPRCGLRRFVDRETPCGEHAPRLCVRGAATQNSHRYLLQLLGPARRAQGASTSRDSSWARYDGPGGGGLGGGGLGSGGVGWRRKSDGHEAAERWINPL